MPQFSARSKSRLATCHPELQRLFNEVIKEVDCTVLCGHRTKAEQDEAVKNKVSKLAWPKSKHNKLPSLAVDVAPYPIDWNDVPRFIAFAEVVKAKAKELGIKIRWGGDWNSNGDHKDEKFFDGPHFELMGY